MDNTEAIGNMIDKIVGGDNTAAKEDFEALISAKLSNALDAKKQEVAASIYDSQKDTEEQEDLDIEELTDYEQDTEEA